MTTAAATNRRRPTANAATGRANANARARKARRPMDDPKKRREAIRLATRIAILVHGDALRDLAHR